MLILLIVVGWLACAVFAVGAMFANMQSQFPETAEKEYREDAGMALLFGLLFGPIAALAAIFLSGFLEYGWRLPRPVNHQAREERRISSRW